MAKAILEGKKFAVRALTRDVTQPNALALQDLGAEVVKGDLDDEASVEAALKGAYGAFLVTSIWNSNREKKEVCQVGTPLHPFLLPSLAALPSLEGGRPSSLDKNINLIPQHFSRTYEIYIFQVLVQGVFDCEISVT